RKPEAISVLSKAECHDREHHFRQNRNCLRLASRRDDRHFRSGVATRRRSRQLMRSVVLALLRYRTLVLIALGAWIALGIWGFIQLDIEAYPDPSPPLVEIITQNP